MCSVSSCSSTLFMLTVVLTFLSLVSADCPAKCHCTRYKTFCNLARLNTLPTLLPSTTVHLVIEADNISVINKRIFTHPGLHRLSHLQLVNVHLKRIRPKTFQNMSQLQYLQICYNNIRVLKTNSFKYLENLYLLNISNNEIYNLQPGTFSGLLNLRYLDITYNNIRVLKANLFDGMKMNTNCDMINIPVIYQFISEKVELDVFHKICSLRYFAMGYTVEYRIPSHISDGLILYPPEGAIIYKRSYHDLSGISYLLLKFDERKTYELKIGFFQNLKQLTYLDIQHSNIIKIQSGAFQGLVSLKVLNLNGNSISYLNSGTFSGLDSLKRLEMADCKITRIDSNAFEGLSKLEFLDLSGNYMYVLETNTFFGLYMLKHLMLPTNKIKQIDRGTFLYMTNLKSLLKRSPVKRYQFGRVNNFGERIIYFRIFGFNDEHAFLNLHLFDKIKETFQNLARLDNLDIDSRISLPKDIQVLRYLHFYLYELQQLVQTVNYVKELEITLLHINSTQILSTLSDIQLSSLTLSYSDIEYINYNNLTSLSKLKTLTIWGNNTYTIQQEAFQEMKSLQQLTLLYELDLHYQNGSFHGLDNLEHLSILYLRSFSPYQTKHDTKYKSLHTLHTDTFQGLQNLKQLELENNKLIDLELGAFQGLYNIEQIYLGSNYIDRINAGVFGAVCEQGFQLSCKNATLPDYCNNINALTTLQYLNLEYNSISYIHPHAFIGCNNLHTLDLNNNGLLALDKPFLFTPSLRKLIMSDCSIRNIPDDTFACTPLLSHIIISYNGLNKLKLSTLQHLKHLQLINVEYTALYCDCELYETWLWMRQQRVHYNFIVDAIYFDYLPIDEPYCMSSNIDISLSIMECNKTLEKSYTRKNITITRDDFEFFKQYIEPLVLIITLIFGLTCNGFLLFISLRHSDMRTKQNTLVIHLATVDVLSLILNLPLSYWDTVNVTWEFDHTLCKIFILTKDMMVGVVVSNVVALSLERYFVAKIFKNLKNVCISERFPTSWLVLMTWICAIVTSLPAYFSATVVDARCLYCPPEYHNYIRNVWTFQLVTYCLIPAAAVTFLNIKTSLILRESVRKIPGEIKNNIHAKHRIIVANVVLILAVVFIISYLPNHILRVLVAWSVVDMENVLLPSFFTFCLFFCNTVFNPISLFIMSSKFKSYALSYFPFLGNQ